MYKPKLAGLWALLQASGLLALVSLAENSVLLSWAITAYLRKPQTSSQFGVEHVKIAALFKFHIPSVFEHHQKCNLPKYLYEECNYLSLSSSMRYQRHLIPICSKPPSHLNIINAISQPSPYPLPTIFISLNPCVPNSLHFLLNISSHAALASGLVQDFPMSFSQRLRVWGSLHVHFATIQDNISEWNERKAKVSGGKWRARRESDLLHSVEHSL